MKNHLQNISKSFSKTRLRDSHAKNPPTACRLRGTWTDPGACFDTRKTSSNQYHFLIRNTSDITKKSLFPFLLDKISYVCSLFFNVFFAPLTLLLAFADRRLWDLWQLLKCLSEGRRINVRQVFVFKMVCFFNHFLKFSLFMSFCLFVWLFA